ncbi:uncharacterized protein BDR25DRAFT_350007 [Lindgomyces ingoldianus]|uniref:Uncharacterized protein n=1 Tax=Lindgomyces ingoldianus TaxID=673940 RepID=A0ACB6R8T8_9PLEO|nr:uncharacterized protein BDR25DRAFT_350007 [Lindgomyces ingoldianus]KAF2475728.1 hypothetical protein BDR25DRAFT_350007 [Lindgomyces ingoldianus]
MSETFFEAAICALFDRWRNRGPVKRPRGSVANPPENRLSRRRNSKFFLFCMFWDYGGAVLQIKLPLKLLRSVSLSMRDCMSRELRSLYMDTFYSFLFHFAFLIGLLISIPPLVEPSIFELSLHLQFLEIGNAHDLIDFCILSAFKIFNWHCFATSQDLFNRIYYGRSNSWILSYIPPFLDRIDQVDLNDWERCWGSRFGSGHYCSSRSLTSEFGIRMQYTLQILPLARKIQHYSHDRQIPALSIFPYFINGLGFIGLYSQSSLHMSTTPYWLMGKLLDFFSEVSPYQFIHSTKLLGMFRKDRCT